MPKFKLEDVTIEFPENPTKIWNNDNELVLHDYKVLGFFGPIELGHITVSITIKLPTNEKNDFLFNLRTRPIRARPYVFYQDTKEDYKGLGISGRMIILANEITKVRFNEPLSSSTSFLRNVCKDFFERNYSEFPGKRVWEKLESQGLAYSKPYDNKPRWIMR